jgi:hypothetical protein
MQDELSTSPPIAPVRRPRSGQGMLVIALVAFMLGIALAGWLVWTGKLSDIFRRGTEVVQTATPVPATTAASPSQISTTPLPPPTGLGAVETRLALMEERMSRLDLKAEAASGNAARAEALLVAFAVRRKIDSGEPLGYLEDQVRLRFGDAQPNAVQTIVGAGSNPVTLDQLVTQLMAASPALTSAPKDEGAWAQVKRELSSLVTIRRDTTPSPAPQNRIERARLMLASGQVDEAIAEVERLPGAGGAQDWISAARRYAEAQRALDLIETTAMLEPYRLQDGDGRKVEQSSPFGAPAGTN